MIIENLINSVLHFTPEIILFLMSMVVLIFGVFKSTKRYVFHTTMFSVIIAIISCVAFYPDNSLLLFNSVLIKSDITEFFKFICFFIFVMQLIVSRNYLKERQLDSGELYSLLIFALLGCFIIISANNLILLFLGIELSSLSLYSLIALNRSSFLSSEAAIKYFILSIIASAIILFGFSYLYGITNTLSISNIVSYTGDNDISNLYLFSYVW